MITQRVHIPGGMYHITQRGNSRNKIFFSDEDRAYFCLLMQKYFTKYHHRVHAFCLMDNHIHLLIQAGPRPFSKAIQSIISIHARMLNKKYSGSGHRFQCRYFSSIVDTDEHLLTVLKYIHMNPVKAKMIQSPSEYFWCTHNHYTLNENIAWVERDFCLSLFDENIDLAAIEYGRYMECELKDEEIKKIKSPAHGYIIGSDEFIARTQAKAQQVMLLRQITVREILQDTCDYFHYPIKSVSIRIKDPMASKIRSIAGYIIRHHTALSQSQLANLTNRGTSTISDSINVLEKRITSDFDLLREIESVLDKISSRH